MLIQRVIDNQLKIGAKLSIYFGKESNSFALLLNLPVFSLKLMRTDRLFA
jgi:hypothetical protein